MVSNIVTQQRQDLHQAEPQLQTKNIGCQPLCQLSWLKTDTAIQL